jgi:hypothetical protein
MAYEGGYTSAVNSQAERDAREAYVREIAREAQMDQWKRQQYDIQQQQQLRQFANNWQALLGQQAQTGQPPMPGAGSVPMLPPGAPPMGLMGAMAGGPPPPMPAMSMPPRSPDQIATMSPQLAPPGAGALPVSPATAPPPGWKSSPAAPPELGGGQPPGGGAAGSPAGAAPPPVAPMGAPPGAGGPQGPGDVLPRQMMTYAGAIESIKKLGLDPAQSWQAFEAMKPIIDQQNDRTMKNAQAEAKMWKEFVDTTLKGRNINSLVDTRKRREDRMEGKSSFGTAEGQGSEEYKDAVDFYALSQLGGDVSWKTALGRTALGGKLVVDVEKRVASLAKELNLSPGEVIANKGETQAVLKAMVDRQKFIAAANQFTSNLESQMSLVKELMDAGSATGVPALNRWIQAGRKAIAGDPDVTALDTALRGLAREHQRIVTGVTSNAQLHVSAQHTADELLNVDQAPEQMLASMRVMAKEAENARSNGVKEMEELRGQIKKNVPSMPSTRSAPSATHSVNGAPAIERKPVTPGSEATPEALNSEVKASATVGEIRPGREGKKYRFKGGDPVDKKNWEEVRG